MEKYRAEGQVARSKELNTLLVLIAGSAGLLIFGPLFYEGGIELFRFNMMLERETLYDGTRLGAHMGRSSLGALSITLPFFLMTLLAAFVGPVSMGGWLISPKAMEPKFSRMNPLKGIKRMFSLNALMELLKALAKFLVVAVSAILVLYLSLPEIELLGKQSVDVAIPSAAYILIFSFFMMSLSIIIITIVDIPFQIFDHSQKLKMTRQEVKDELKNTEGKPEVKGRIRQVQQEMAKKRMMTEVPDADVVITNPSHFAVALKYDPENMASPKLVAKGVDHIAAHIREIAKANDVTIVSYPILARSLFFSTELDQYIPKGLYVAVAQVLAYVFQLNQYRNGEGKAPRPLGSLDIPDEFVQLANRG